MSDLYRTLTPSGRLLFLTLREWMRGDDSVQVPSLVHVLQDWTGLSHDEVVDHLPEVYTLLDVDVPRGVVRSLPSLKNLLKEETRTNNSSAAPRIVDSFLEGSVGEPSDVALGSFPSLNFKALDAMLTRPGYAAVARAVEAEPTLRTLLAQCHTRVRHFDGFLGEVQAIVVGLRANTPAPTPLQLAAALQDLIANGAILSAATVRAYVRRAVVESQRSPGSGKGDPFASRLRELEGAS